jgi:hypothetical protein
VKIPTTTAISPRRAMKGITVSSVDSETVGSKSDGNCYRVLNEKLYDNSYEADIKKSGKNILNPIK